MASVTPRQVVEFQTAYPNANEALIVDSARAAGVINGGIRQLLGLCLENLGQDPEGIQKASNIFGGDIVGQYWQQQEADGDR